MRNLIFSVLLASLASLAMPLMASSDNQQKQQAANALYDAGNFAKAYSKYESLAKDGDSFSQYRVSYMNLMAQGGNEDVVESLAWAVLAAQNRQDELVEYMQTVAEMVPQNQRKKADKKIAYYMRKWGNDARGSSAQRGDAECTGTRLCNHKSTARSVRVPANLWTSNSDNTSIGIDTPQQLKGRAVNLNHSIQEIYGSPVATALTNEGES